MKKLLVLLTMFSTLLFVSCGDNDDDKKTTTFVKVTVKEDGKIKSGITVCMFDALRGNEKDFLKPMFAMKKVVTDSNGIATFELQEVANLEVIDTQTTLYFAVFKDKKILGKTALTIKEGETKNVEINY